MSCSNQSSADIGVPAPVSRYQHLASRSGRVVIVVLREPRGSGRLLSDGEAMIAMRPTRCSAPAGPRLCGEISAGERLADYPSGLIVTTPYGGNGVLTFDGRPLRPVRPFAADGTRESGARR